MFRCCFHYTVTSSCDTIIHIAYNSNSIQQSQEIMACGSHIADNTKENAKTRSSIPGKGGQSVTQKANKYMGNECLCVYPILF